MFYKKFSIQKSSLKIKLGSEGVVKGWEVSKHGGWVGEEGVHDIGKWVGIQKEVVVLSPHSTQFHPTFNPVVSPTHI